VHRRERAQGPFARTIALPFRVDAEKVAARFDRGVLTLTLPRPEADKPRQVKVTRA
jgi:HSP20 family protein